MFSYKRIYKIVDIFFIILIDLTHDISFIIKFAYAKAIMKKELINTIGKYHKYKTEEEQKEYGKIAKLIWFYRFDIFIITFICMFGLLQILMAIIIPQWCRFFEFGEIKKIF